MARDRGLGGRFTRLWTATAISNLADGVLLVGAPLLAVELTRSPLLVSLTSTLATMPWLAIPLVAGALADRHDRRAIIRNAALARASFLCLVGVASIAGWFDLPMLYALVVLVSTAEVFADTTTQSILPMLVDRERLSAANGRIISTQRVAADLVGGPVAGVLVALGSAALFGGAAALFVVTAGVVATLPGNYRLGTGTAATGSLRGEIGEGLRFLTKSPVLRDLAMMAGALNLAASAYLAVFVLWAVGAESAVGLRPHQYGFLMALVGVGGAAGALIVERASDRFTDTALLHGSAAAGGALLLIPVTVPRLTAIAPALVAVGVANAFTNVLIVSMRQRLIPPPLLGRVNATYRLIGMGTMPIGALLGGAAAEQVGVRNVLLGAAVATIVAAAAGRSRVTQPAVDAASP